MARRGDLNGWWRFGLAVVGPLVGVLFRMRVTGVEHVPPSGPAIVAANHVSALDGVLLAVVVGRDGRRMTRFVTGAEFFRKPLFGWALRLFRQIPIRRGGGDEGALDEAVTTVRSGALAGIFPEGRVNAEPDDGLQRGRTGVARIALAAKAPVVPVGIWGTQRRWPRAGLTWRRPWRPTVALAFGTPVIGDGEPSDARDTQRLTALVMEGIGKAVEEARRSASGDASSSPG
jgi:1-acyl-sn-glycerol-3-phosphate acyltransferase